MCDKVDRIIAHGCNVFTNRQLIYNLPEQRSADSGIMSIEHADFDGTERLALVLGADIVSTFDTPEDVKLGQCDLIEVMVGEDIIASRAAPTRRHRRAYPRRQQPRRRGVPLAARRAVRLSQTVSTVVLPGGGATEMLMAQAVEEASKKVSGKQVLAMEAYARALRSMPMHIADNAGYDSADLVSQLRATTRVSPGDWRWRTARSATW